MGSTPAAQQADAFQDCYIPISAEGGKLLYALVRSARPDTVVEFGTSFGISTIYLAAAIADNGTGHVIGTELSARKVQAARSNLAPAGLSEAATIIPGDARQTLAKVPGRSAWCCSTGGNSSACPCCACWSPGSPRAR